MLLTMRIGVLRATEVNERRAAASAESVKLLRTVPKAPKRDDAAAAPSSAASAPPTVLIETGVGVAASITDDAYRAAGAEVTSDRRAVVSGSDIVLGVDRPSDADIAAMRPGSVYLGFVDVFRDHELVRGFARAGVSVLAMELMPRTTKAQAMDALSSQHSIAGYAMAVLAATRLPRVMPMMVTPSGTIKPAKVLVIGAGVAGLQAIATCRRLGARVEGYDTRPETREQVMSLGAQFVELPQPEAGVAGPSVYAKELTPEQQARQRELLAGRVAGADAVITTAALFGRPAPRIISAEMVERMNAGAVIIDYAARSGGNCELTVPGRDVLTPNGVLIIGDRNYPSLAAGDATRMYAANLAAAIGHLRSLGMAAGGSGPLLAGASALSDPIVAACLVTHAGEVVSDAVRKAMGLPGTHDQTASSPTTSGARA